MESADDDLSFLLDLPHLRVSGRWTPTAGERGVCRDIVRRVDHGVPSRDTDPRVRYTTMARFFFDAMDALRAAPSKSLPTLPTGQLPPSSLASMMMDATLAVGELVRSGRIAELADDTARRFADEIEPEVLEFRRAVGIAGGGDATFWTSAGPGEGPSWSVRPRETTVATVMQGSPDPPQPAPQTAPPGRRRFRWWNR